MEMAEHSLIVWRLRLRQRMGGRHYASLIGNYAQQDDRFFDMWGRRGIWGGGVSYSRDSRLGPIDIVFSLSDRDKKLKFYFDLGFLLLTAFLFELPDKNVYGLTFLSDIVSI